jgi:hypothetical protein
MRRRFAIRFMARGLAVGLWVGFIVGAVSGQNPIGSAAMMMAGFACIIIGERLGRGRGSRRKL